MRRVLALFPLLAALPAALPALGQPAPRVQVHTSAGPLTLELFPEEAPLTVARFLARAGLAAPPRGVDRVAALAGSQLCEVRAHGYMVFGCLPYQPGPQRPRAPGIEPPTPEEIDGRGLGLHRRRIDDIVEREWLWQQEIFPRYQRLREAGRPVPRRLKSLVEGVLRGGMARTARLSGRTRLWYLEALGFEYRGRGSSRKFEKGAVGTANFWPQEADERFLIALADLPDRDGRGTVFGRVVGGLENLQTLENLPVDKSRRPLAPILIEKIYLMDNEP